MYLRSVCLLVILFSVPVSASAECKQSPFSLELPSQRMDERLQNLAHQTGCFVEVDPALLGTMRAPAVSGVLTPRQAFSRSLKGSGLRYRFVKDHWKITSQSQTTDHPIHDSFVQPW
ncbi:hypothetical protein M2305_000678 [Gluconobacter cerinus]|nr:hypothetical protein [Gluconobacter cerinus]